MSNELSGFDYEGMPPTLDEYLTFSASTGSAEDEESDVPEQVDLRVSLPALPASADWMVRAACRDLHPDLFYPARGDHLATAKARLVCASCPVQEECRTHALTYPESFGMWGGMTQDELRQARGRVLGSVWFDCAWCGKQSRGTAARKFCSRACRNRDWDARHPESARGRQRLAKQRMREQAS